MGFVSIDNIGLEMRSLNIDLQSPPFWWAPGWCLTPMRLSRMYSLRLKRVTPSRVSSSIWTGFTLPRMAPAEIRMAAVQKSALTMLGRRGEHGNRAGSAGG